MGKTCKMCGKIKEDSKIVQSGISFCCKECLKKYDIIKCSSCGGWERREKMTIADNFTVCSNCKRRLINEFLHGD